MPRFFTNQPTLSTHLLGTLLWDLAPISPIKGHYKFGMLAPIQLESHPVQVHIPSHSTSAPASSVSSASSHSSIHIIWNQVPNIQFIIPSMFTLHTLHTCAVCNKWKLIWFRLRNTSKRIQYSNDTVRWEPLIIIQDAQSPRSLAIQEALWSLQPPHLWLWSCW